MALPARYAEEPFDEDWYPEAEYFALEERSQARWEFLPEGSHRPGCPRLGRIRAMSGGTVEHGVIGANLLTALKIALGAAGVQTCRVFGSDVKIRTEDGRNTYPDVGVLCGKPNLYRGRRDTVTNPILVAEALSPSTEAYDRSEKWGSYQTIPTLQHYLLVSADRARVEVYTREEQGWRYVVAEGLEARLPLAALGVTLSLTDIYDLVEFSPEAAGDESGEKGEI
jgi:Uma2 family endonuclease